MLSAAPKRIRGAGPFTKGLLLLTVLVLVWLVSSHISSRGLPGSFTGMFSARQYQGPGYQPFDTTAQKAVVRSVAGFWSAEPGAGRSVVRVRDRIELKDNGIVWRVVTHTAALPSGDTARFLHVYDAYLRPFGWVKGADSVAACDVRVLRQARVAGPDTCYGPTDVDTVWEVSVKGRVPGLAGVRFDPFTGDIHSLFPAGAVKMLEDAYRGTGRKGPAVDYRVSKGEVRLAQPVAADHGAITFDLKPCGPDIAPVTFVRRALARALAAAPAQDLDTARLAALADTTYGSLLRMDIHQRYRGVPLPTVTFRVEVAAEGTANVTPVTPGTAATPAPCTQPS